MIADRSFCDTICDLVDDEVCIKAIYNMKDDDSSERSIENLIEYVDKNITIVSVKLIRAKLKSLQYLWPVYNGSIEFGNQSTEVNRSNPY